MENNSFIDNILNEITQLTWNEIRGELTNPHSTKSINAITQVIEELYGSDIAYEFRKSLLEQSPTPPTEEKPKEENPLEKDLDAIKFGMMTDIEKEAYLKKKREMEQSDTMDLEEDVWVKNKKSGSVYQVKKFNKTTQDPATKSDIEKAEKEKSDSGEFNETDNTNSLNSFIKVGFTNSKGAPGSAGSMLNEITSITSATDSFNSKKPFDYETELANNVEKFKNSRLGAENDGDKPPKGVKTSDAKKVAKQYGISVGLAGKLIAATRAAQNKHNHISEQIVNRNGLKNTKAFPFFGDGGGLKSQENAIRSTTGRVMLGNTEVTKEQALEIVKSGGGGKNPSDTAIFVRDEDTGDMYMTFYSDKDDVGAIVAQSTLKAEVEVKKENLKKLYESGKMSKKEFDLSVQYMDNVVEQHNKAESELKNTTLKPIKHLNEQNPEELVKTAKTLSAGSNPEKYWSAAIKNQILGKKPNKLLVSQLPKNSSNPPTDAEMIQAFIKYCSLEEGSGNNQRPPLTKPQLRMISDLNKKTNGPKIGSDIGQIRKKTIQNDLKLLKELDKRKIKLENGNQVGLGTYLEANSVAEKLHLDMMFGGEGVFSDPTAFYQESGGVKVNKESLSKCLPFSDKNDMISHFEISEENEVTNSSGTMITGGSKIVYAITKEGNRVPIAEKKQRSKQGDLGRLNTVYNYHPELQDCLRKNG